MARRPIEDAHSLKRPLAVLLRWPASDAGCTSAVQSADQALPTRSGRSTRAGGDLRDTGCAAAGAATAFIPAATSPGALCRRATGSGASAPPAPRRCAACTRGPVRCGWCRPSCPSRLCSLASQRTAACGLESSTSSHGACSRLCLRGSNCAASAPCGRRAGRTRSDW